jgi:hypothetical protein
MRPRGPWGTVFYATAIAISAVLIFHLQLIPVLTGGILGLITLWAFGYGITDASLLAAYTVARALKGKA